MPFSLQRTQCCSISNWSQIQDDVYQSILERLCFTDYLQMSAVCSSWRANVARAIANKHCPPASQLPLLLLHSTDKKVDFFDCTTERLSNSINVPFGGNWFFHGMTQGWMIVGEIAYVFNSQAIFFWNPITNATIKIPSLLKCPATIRKIVASSTPSNPECLVVVLFNDFYHFAFTKISGKSWTIVEGDKDAGIFFMELEILNGKLYVLTHRMKSDSILVYDLHEPGSPPKPKILAKLPEARPPMICTMGYCYHLTRNKFSYLAIDATSGEILLIYMFYKGAVFVLESLGFMNVVNEYLNPPAATGFKVFKLESSSEIHRWVEVHNLGKRLLFVGSRKCLVTSTSALEGPEELIEENSIYFSTIFSCPIDPWRGVKILKFRMTDSSFRYFNLNKSSFVTSPIFAWWFIPNVW